MTAALLLILATCGLLAEDIKNDAEEMKRLEGSWKLVSLEAGGKKGLSGEGRAFDKIVIAGGKLTMSNSPFTNLPVKIDATQKPKSIDLLLPKEAGGKPWYGIYSLDGDELKLCLIVVKKGEASDARRPDTFETKDKPLMLLTLKREKQ